MIQNLDGSSIKFNYNYDETGGYSANNRLKPNLNRIDYLPSNGDMQSVIISFNSASVDVIVPGGRKYFLQATTNFSDDGIAPATVYFNKIVDPLGNETHISYDDFSFRHYGLWHNSEDVYSSNFSSYRAYHVQHDLKRISRITQPTGQIDSLEYYTPETTDDLGGTNATMTLRSYESNSNFKYMSTFYRRTGKEIFSSSFIKRHAIFDHSLNLKLNRLYYFFYFARSQNGVDEHITSSSGKAMILPKDDQFAAVLESDNWLQHDADYYLSYDHTIYELPSNSVTSLLSTVETAIEDDYARAMTIQHYKMFWYWQDGIVPSYAQTDNTSDTKKILQYRYIVDAGEMTKVSESHYRYDLGDSKIAKVGSHADSVYNGMMFMNFDSTITFRDGKKHISWNTYNQDRLDIFGPLNDSIPIFRLTTGTRSENHLGVEKKTSLMTEFHSTTYDSLLNSLDIYPHVLLNRYIKTKTDVNGDSTVNYQFFEYDYPLPFAYERVKFSTIELLNAEDESYFTLNGDTVGELTSGILEKPNSSQHAGLEAHFWTTPAKNVDYDILGHDWTDWDAVQVVDSGVTGFWYVPANG